MTNRVYSTSLTFPSHSGRAHWSPPLGLGTGRPLRPWSGRCCGAESVPQTKDQRVRSQSGLNGPYSCNDYRVPQDIFQRLAVSTAHQCNLPVSKRRASR
eukprot:5978624-Prymnesium_polylepis.1